MFFNLVFLLLLIFELTSTCQGFYFTMDRREYLVKNQTFCGLLQCQVDTVSDTYMASLIQMDIYYLKNEQLLASMLAEITEIQYHTGNSTKVIGSMSKDHGEFHVYFSEVSRCFETAFICKIQFKNSTNGKDIAEKFISPISSDQRKTVNTQNSIEHKIFDKPEAIRKKLNSHTSLMNEETGHSFELGNAGLPNSEEISIQHQNSQKTIGENAEHIFEQKLADFEMNIRAQLELFMIQMSRTIQDNKSTPKEIQSNLNELKKPEIIRRSKQSISALIQSHIEQKLSTYERRMDEIIDKIDHVNVSLNVHELRTHTSGLEIIQKLDFLLADKNLFGLNSSNLEIKVKEVMNSDGIINNKLQEIQHGVNGINKLLKEGEMMDTIQQSLTLLHTQLNESKLLNGEVIMGESGHLKCERGMSVAPRSRVITSLDDNKQVLCDTVTDGGGWIILQRRANGQVNFTRNWNDYKNGFGSLVGDFWIGNEFLSNITSKEMYTLRIDMGQGSNAYRAEYDSFMVKNESEQFRLSLGVFSGNIRDLFRYHNNMAFSTPDRDNDIWKDGSCAQRYKSGWWFGPDGCYRFHLNGVWGSYTDSGLCFWEDSPAEFFFLDFVEMKMRRK